MGTTIYDTFNQYSHRPFLSVKLTIENLPCPFIYDTFTDNIIKKNVRKQYDYFKF